MTRFDAWTLARLVAGLPVNGELQAVSRPFKDLAAHLAGLPPEARQIALDGFLRHPGIDGERIIRAIDDADPSGLPPEAGPAGSFATLADYARIASGQHWLWEGWIARGVLNAVASD